MSTHKQVPKAQADAEDSGVVQPQFINKVVDVRVTRQRQVPQSKWR